MKSLIAMFVAVCCLLSTPALASEAAPPMEAPVVVNEFSTMTPAEWSRRVRRARTTTSLGIALMIPADVILLGGMGIAAVGDSDALLAAGLGGAFFGLAGTYPIYSGTGSLRRALIASGSPQTKVLKNISIGSQVASVVMFVVAAGTGDVRLFAVSLGFAAVHVNTSLVMGFQALKRSRGLADTPVVTQRVQWAPVVAPTPHGGLVGGLVMQF